MPTMPNTPGTTPDSSDSGTLATAATTAAMPTARRDTSPSASGLSGRPACASRCASSQSFVQPTASWLASTATVIVTVSTARRPPTMVSRQATTVTAAPGSGWLALHQSAYPHRGTPNGSRCGDTPVAAW